MSVTYQSSRPRRPRGPNKFSSPALDLLNSRGIKLWHLGNALGWPWRLISEMLAGKRAPHPALLLTVGNLTTRDTAARVAEAMAQARARFEETIAEEAGR